MEIKKSEVEVLLGFEVTEKQYIEALELAKIKQQYIYKNSKRKVVLQSWYLAKLTEEYVRTLSLSKSTMDLCELINYDIEKEHPANTEYSTNKPYCNTICLLNQ